MTKALERIADALEHIHVELKRLNDTNPSNQAQAKPKQDKRNHLNIKTLFEVVLMSKREIGGPISRW